LFTLLLGWNAWLPSRTKGRNSSGSKRESTAAIFYDQAARNGVWDWPIVAKRVAGLAGELKVISPASNGHGHKMPVSYLAFFASPQQRRLKSGG